MITINNFKIGDTVVGKNSLRVGIIKDFRMYKNVNIYWYSYLEEAPDKFQPNINTTMVASLSLLEKVCPHCYKSKCLTNKKL